MRIVDLAPQYEDSYLVCLEDWSTEMAEAGKLAVDNDDAPIGMVQYLPIEQSPAIGEDLYMILCIWVHGHKEGVGNRQGRGAGSALLAAAEADVRNLGAKGLAAWGLRFPVWMKASWFRRHGYRKVDRNGIRVLLWKPFAADAVPPRWIEPGPRPPRIEGKVAVTAFVNGWCPASNLVYERAKRAAAALGDDIVLETFDTSEQKAMIRCGQSDCVYLDGKTLQKGPPLSYDRIYRSMARRVGKLDR